MNPNVVELVNPDESQPCCFCSRYEINPVEWGPMYKLDDVVLHYFCMLFSSGLVQEGEDDQGVLGFLPKDIRKEVSRGKKLKCRFCRKSSATVGCIVTKCRYSFHYPCGLENGTLHQFQGHFASYCQHHKPKQQIPKQAEWVCPICMMEVENDVEAVWPPCCGKSVFHRRCIMHAAKEAGYFFKCPLCNSTDEFLEAMKANGVYVPEQDAAWETVPGAYAELTEHYTLCDAEACLCPHGRGYESKENKSWKIIRCNGCGASAIHMTCGSLHIFSWKCSTCENVLKNMTERKAVSSDAISPSAAVVAPGADEQDSEDESTSSESESESSEESSESSETSESDEGARISKTVLNPTKLIQKRRRQLRSESENEMNDETSQLSEENLAKPLVYNLKFGRSYKVQGDNEPLIETRVSNASTSRLSRYKSHGQNINDVAHSPNKNNRPKFLSPPNRIRNPHLHNTPTFGRRLEQLRQSQYSDSIVEVDFVSDGEDVDTTEKTKVRLNSILSIEETTARAKKSNDCIKRVLQEAQRPVLDITSVPRIPKLPLPRIPKLPLPIISQQHPPPVQFKHVLEKNTSPQMNSNVKTLGQTKLDRWLDGSLRKTNELQQFASTVQTQCRPHNTRRNFGCRIDLNELMDHRTIKNDDKSPVQIDEEIPGTSSSQSVSSSDTTRRANVKTKRGRKKSLPKEKFKPPNKSRHRSNRKLSPLPIKPSTSESDIDSEIEFMEEKKPTLKFNENNEYTNKKYEEIPKSTAFLSMVAGHENRLLGLEILKSEKLSPCKNKPEDVDVIDLLSDDDDDDEKDVTKLLNPLSINKGFGLGLTTTTISGTYFYQNSLNGQIPHDYWFNSSNITCIHENLKNLYTSLYPGRVELPKTDDDVLNKLVEDEKEEETNSNLKLNSNVLDLNTKSDSGIHATIPSKNSKSKVGTRGKSLKRKHN